MQKGHFLKWIGALFASFSLQKPHRSEHSTFWQKGFLRKRNSPHPSEFRSWGPIYRSKMPHRSSQKGNFRTFFKNISFLGNPKCRFGTPKLRNSEGVGVITFAQKALLPKSRMVGEGPFLHRFCSKNPIDPEKKSKFDPNFSPISLKKSFQNRRRA